MKFYNNLSVEVFSSGTTRIVDPINDLRNIDGLRFSTGYPGGLYLDGSFKVHRDILKRWSIQGGYRVIIRNGLTVVYEGYVNDLTRVLEQDSEYIEVPLVGGWSKIMMSRRWRKHWANDNVDDRTWVWQTAYSGHELCGIDRTDRLRFTPKAEQWDSGQIAAVKFSMPTGEVIRRIGYDYDMAEDSQNWVLEFNDATNGQSTIVDSTSSDSDISYAPGTATNAIEIRFRAGAQQTPTSDGDCYAEVTNLVVFGGEASTNNIDLTQVATDIVSQFSAVLNSSTDYIDTITQTSFDTTYDGATQITGIVPFVEDDFPTIADIIADMAGYGDDSFNAWGYGLYNSVVVASPDGKPVLFIEQQPALTDYDYIVSYDEKNLAGALAIDENFDELYNWIVVEYVDANGWVQYVSPDNDANLKDTTSITDYGQRDHVLSIGDATQTIAINYGRRFLAKHKDPQWKASQPITVVGYIRKKDGSQLPSSQIRAGKRLRIANYLNDLSGIGLTLLITGTQYDDTTETCSISFGRLDDWFITPFEHPIVRNDQVGRSSQSAGGSGSRRETDFMKLGYSAREWYGMSKDERRAIRQRGIREGTIKR